MIVTLGDDQLHGLAGFRQCGRKVARLPLEFRRLQGADGQHQRRVDFVEMAHGGQRLLHRVGEFHIARARRHAHRLQVVHAAAEHGALEDIARQPLLLPLGDHHAAAEVTAGREAREIERIGIAAKAFCVAIDPRHRAPALVDHGRQVALRFRHVVEFDIDEVCAGLDERLGVIGALRRAAAAPGAAVQKDHGGRARPLGLVNVNLLDLRRAVGDALGLAEHLRH